MNTESAVSLMIILSCGKIDTTQSVLFQRGSFWFMLLYNLLLFLTVIRGCFYKGYN